MIYKINFLMKKFLQILFLSLWVFFFLWTSLWNLVFANWTQDSAHVDSKTSFDLNTLFTNDHLSTEKKWIHTISWAIWAIVKMITWIIWWFAVLWTILWGFMILISWWSDDWVTKWKKYIQFSLIWIAVSLVSYTLIQLVQLFLFSFSK